MKLPRSVAAMSLAGVLLLAACGATAASTDATSATAGLTSTSTPSAAAATAPQRRRGLGDGVDLGAVSTEAELVALVQDAYGDGSLDLHRGHQPVQDVLDEVLAISHDELHVRMEEQGQNLAAVATDLGIEPQSLIDALVASRSDAVDAVLVTGAISDAEAEQYLKALEDAFTFRVTWDGETEMPASTGV